VRRKSCIGYFFSVTLWLKLYNMELFNKTAKEKIDNYNNGTQPIATRMADDQPNTYIKEYMNFMANLPYGNDVTPEASQEDSQEDSKIPSKPIRKDYVTRQSPAFSDIDVSNPNGHAKYTEISQKFIDSKNQKAGVTGKMLADSAKATYNKYGIYVPPELALAQLYTEGGLGKDPKKRPIYTNNPFNVGNTDDNKNRYFPTIKEAVDKYFDLVATAYLGKNKTANDLMNNYVDLKNRRYASAKNYEEVLRQVTAQIHNNFSSPILNAGQNV